MGTQYSLHEAKARLSEIIRMVRERGETFTVSYHGRPVAEIRPIPSKEGTVEERLRELEDRGILEGPTAPPDAFPPAMPGTPGVLDRFLEDRQG
jgi:prevent-host-death family protein